MQAALFGFALLGIASCTETPSSPAEGGSVVIMRTQPDNSTIHSSSAGISENSSRSFGGMVDSLQITSAVFAASNFMLRNDLSDDTPIEDVAEETIRNDQFVLRFDEPQYIGERTVLAGTYHRARYDIHILTGSADSLALKFGSLYSSIFLGNTIVIHGFVWSDGRKLPFTYASNFSGTQTVSFDIPLVVTPGAPREVFVRFDPYTFSSGGILLDPRDDMNTSAI